MLTAALGTFLNDSRNSLPESLFREGANEEALEKFNKILAIDPKNQGINLAVLPCKGFTLYSLCRYEEAVEIFDEVLKIDSNLTPISYSKADALRHLGKYQEAIELYDKMLKIEPKNIDALMNTGFCLNELGKHQEVIKICDKILEIEPCNIKAIDNKAYLLNYLQKLGVDINIANSVVNIIKFKIPNTNFWFLGEQKKDEAWNAYILDPNTNRREILRENVSTASFEKFSATFSKADTSIF